MMLRLRIREESREPRKSEERPDENHYVRSVDFELRTLEGFGSLSRYMTLFCSFIKIVI